MNPFPVVVAVLGWICLGLDVGLRGPLSHTLWAAPSFVVPLATFIALCAAPIPALWSALLLGLALDLVTPVAGGSLTIAGPHALGLFLAGQFVLASRGLVIRRHPLTLAALSVAASLVMNIVVVAIFWARQMYSPIEGWSASADLGTGFLSAIITGLAGLIMSIGLLPLSPVLGLPAPHARRR